MILGGNQPYFMPYLGYWQLINAVDIFVISDDYAYIKHGWISKNRILINGNTSNYYIEVNHATPNKLINELYLQDYSVQKKMKPLVRAYGRAPYFDSGLALMEEIFSCKERNLADFLANSIYCVCDYLDIKTKLVRSSSFPGNSDLKREYRIYDMCERLGTDTYYNAIGGMDLYSFEEFDKRGIKLGFLKMDDIVYKQFNSEFVPNLSVIDVIMFNSKDEIREMLKKYTIIKEPKLDV